MTNCTKFVYYRTTLNIMQGMNNKIHFLVSRVIAHSVIRGNPNYKTLQHYNPEDHNMTTAFLCRNILTRGHVETDLSGA